VEDDFDTVLAGAAREGSARIIVTLADDSADDLSPDSDLQNANRERISQLQKALLKGVRIRHSRSVKRFENLPLLAMSVDANELRLLRASPQVGEIFEDKLYTLTRHEFSIAQIGADTGWLLGHLGAGQTVVIVDNGVDKNHPLLVNKVVKEACFSTRDPQRRISPRCGGRATKRIGLNTAAVTCGFMDFDCTHGTFNASLAAGNSLTPDFFGSGVAPLANIIAIKVDSLVRNRRVCGGQASCVRASGSDVMRALDWVFRLQASSTIAAVNISLETNASPRQCRRDPIKRAVDLLWLGNIATIAASGNGSSPNRLASPACVARVISVGATTSLFSPTDTEEVLPFSNSASSLSLLAPGGGIGLPMPGVVPDGFEVVGSGTSLAAPFVTGAWAVLKSHKPSAGVDEIRAALVNTGKPILDTKNGVVTSRIQIPQAHAALGP
jgi:subtilisin family serine protease